MSPTYQLCCDAVLVFVVLRVKKHQQGVAAGRYQSNVSQLCR